MMMSQAYEWASTKKSSLNPIMQMGDQAEHTL